MCSYFWAVQQCHKRRSFVIFVAQSNCIPALCWPLYIQYPILYLNCDFPVILPSVLIIWVSSTLNNGLKFMLHSPPEVGSWVMDKMWCASEQEPEAVAMEGDEGSDALTPSWDRLLTARELEEGFSPASPPSSGEKCWMFCTALLCCIIFYLNLPLQLLMAHSWLLMHISSHKRLQRVKESWQEPSPSPQKMLPK